MDLVKYAAGYALASATICFAFNRLVSNAGYKQGQKEAANKERG